MSLLAIAIMEEINPNGVNEAESKEIPSELASEAQEVADLIAEDILERPIRIILLENYKPCPNIVSDWQKGIDYDLDELNEQADIPVLEDEENLDLEDEEDEEN